MKPKEQRKNFPLVLPCPQIWSPFSNVAVALPPLPAPGQGDGSSARCQGARGGALPSLCCLEEDFQNAVESVEAFGPPSQLHVVWPAVPTEGQSHHLSPGLGVTSVPACSSNSVGRTQLIQHPAVVGPPSWPPTLGGLCQHNRVQGSTWSKHGHQCCPSMTAGKGRWLLLRLLGACCRGAWGCKAVVAGCLGRGVAGGEPEPGGDQDSSPSAALNILVPVHLGPVSTAARRLSTHLVSGARHHGGVGRFSTMALTWLRPAVLPAPVPRTWPQLGPRDEPETPNVPRSTENGAWVLTAPLSRCPSHARLSGAVVPDFTPLPCGSRAPSPGWGCGCGSVAGAAATPGCWPG